MPSKKLKTKQKPDGGAAEPVAARQWRFEAIGTVWSVDLYTALPAHTAETLLGLVQARIAEYDAHYSRFRSDSLVAAMAATAGVYRLPEDARPLFDLYYELYGLTGGAMTPLIGQALSDAGYDANYSLQAKRLTSPPAWDDVLTYQYPQLHIKRPVLLDVGAAGKGHIVDIIAGLLADHDVAGFCVDAGGDIAHRDPAGRPIRIGLEHPDNPGEVVGVATVANQSICGSAGNRRSWGEFTHILDPHSLASPRHIKALWVVAGSTLLADALTTALFFAPARVLQDRYAFEYAIIHDDYSLERSAGFPGEFFTNNEAKG